MERSITGAPTLEAVAGRQGPEPREDLGPTYADLLRLDELLDLFPRHTDQQDAPLFFVAHMIYELWFKVILYELEQARAGMDADDIPRALYSLRRVRVIEDVLIEQLRTLETISPGGFANLRSSLHHASGLQSVQFREIEFISGQKDPSYLQRSDLSAADRGRLERRLAEPTLADAFQALRERRGDPDLTELLRAEVPRSDVLDLADALIDHDEGFGIWRSRHVHMVERVLGAKPGTGGSSGASYLRSTLEKRFFPELWEIRTRL